MASSYMAFQVSCIQGRPTSTPSNYFHNFTTTLSSALKPLLRQGKQVDRVSETIKSTSAKMLDAFVDSVFQFVDQPLLPSQSNFAPTDELGEPIDITNIEGNIPDNFPEGVYIRNGSNPLFGGLKSTESVFGRSSHVWVEGEGMLHALYFSKHSDCKWTLRYNNRYVETQTFEFEKHRNRPCFLPAAEGDSLSILSAFLLNLLRFGTVNKELSNTNVFEHSGKYYSVAENHIPQEIDIFTLDTLGNWDICTEAWNRPFASHPKRAPGTGELVIIGVDAIKPFLQVGVISADGKELIHKADFKLNRCSLCHDVGVTQRYNVILDFPLIINIMRVVRGGPLIKYNKEGYARIGIMPRFGDANSTCWFEVLPNCTFHTLNCFEDGDEVVVWGCRALDAIVPGPDLGLNKFEWFSKGFKPIEKVPASEGDGSLFSRCYEWRINIKTGQVRERNLTGTEFSMDFPMINPKFTGLKNRFGYTQVVDSNASSSSGMLKFGGVAKLHFEEPDRSKGDDDELEEMIKVEYNMFEKNTYCTGSAFVSKEGGAEEEDEDDGWIITFVHNEDTNISQVYVIDTKRFSNEPIAKITLPCRVPYGFHGAFMPIISPYN